METDTKKQHLKVFQCSDDVYIATSSKQAIKPQGQNWGYSTAMILVMQNHIH